MPWYVIHTKPRQEQRALVNLVQQGYGCYLPLLATEKLRQGALKVVQEPLFARYLFISLDTGQSGKSWAPIRSTQGVSRLVTFGVEPAKVDPTLIEALRANTDGLRERPERLFEPGDRVQIKDGAFAGLEAVYQMPNGESRAMVLIEILSKPVKLTLSPASLSKVA
ncbi:MAG: transcription/translation regulatory transformer protein RfaH [Rhodoferax sp.]|uniref:transcription/translation regulatory transformer protein RfaH n=1 Tax=Rhodoferax sp. TaxID=50421 RepID=UPI00261210BD|nr:transcription/translation regulatory transformer protein RfaH [Rhodoferax sp.]MDD5334855.1 transcription/translation regulatory transformer protein RfaH [Rhodoferax sp.]